MAVAAEVGTVDEEAVGVNATYICTKGMLANHDTVKTHGTDHMVEAGITVEGDTTNPQATTPQLNKSIVARTEGTRRITIIRIISRAGTEVHPNRRMIRDLRINSPPTVAGEGIIPDMMARMAGRTGIPEGEEARLLKEGEFRHMATVGMAIEEVRVGGIGMVAMAVDIIIPRRTVVMAGVATVVEAVITLVGVINLGEAIKLVEVINLVEVTSPVEVISPVEVTSPADRTAPASSLTGAEGGTTREVVVAGEDTSHKQLTSPLLGFTPSIFPPISSRLWGRDPTCDLECVYYILEHRL